jgi:ArsR family transcriptional regulator
MTVPDPLPTSPPEACCAPPSSSTATVVVDRDGSSRRSGCEPSPSSSAALDGDAAGALALRLKALADPTRLRLLAIVAAHDDGEACVCELTDPVALSQPTVSHHLRLLVEAGFLTREKRGVWAYYRLVPDALASAAAEVAALAAM